MDDIMKQNPELMQQFTQAAVNTADATLASTPETLSIDVGPVADGSPNPAYTALQDRIRDLEQVVPELERQLEEVQASGDAEGSADFGNPELTAAYTRKAEYEAILEELETQLADDKQQLQAFVGTPRVSLQTGQQPVARLVAAVIVISVIAAVLTIMEVQAY